MAFGTHDDQEEAINIRAMWPPRNRRVDGSVGTTRQTRNRSNVLYRQRWCPPSNGLMTNFRLISNAVSLCTIRTVFTILTHRVTRFARKSMFRTCRLQLLTPQRESCLATRESSVYSDTFVCGVPRMLGRTRIVARSNLSPKVA